MTRSQLFTASFLFITCMASVGQHKAKPNDLPTRSTILFVCEHGAARSTIAAAYFNRLAKEQGLNYVAIFKGISPDSTLSPAAAKGLKDDRFDVADWVPALVSNQDIQSAYKIVTIDCQLSIPDSLLANAERWSGVQSISTDYGAARNKIVQMVKQLIAQLPKEKK